MEYQDYAEQEQIAFKAYRKSYSLRTPPPEKPSQIKAIADAEMYLLIFVSIASVLLTSLRTAEAFFRSAANSELGGQLISSEVIGWAEAILAIFAIEGSMVVYSMIRAKNSQSTHDGRIYLFGIAVLAVISIVAALGQSINLMDTIDPTVNTWLQWALTLVIGPGGALAALIGGHLLGSRLSDLAAMNAESTDEYKEAMSEWQTGLNNSWNSQKSKIIGKFYSDNGYRPQEPVYVHEPEEQHRQWGKGELLREIQEWLTMNEIDIKNTDSTDIDHYQVAEEIGHHNPESVRVTLAKMRTQ